jgi:carbonic anhydrase
MTRRTIVLLMLIGPTQIGHPLHADEHHSAPVSIPPAEARARLEAGNQRFVSGRPNHPHSNAGWRAGLTGSQHPYATILGCSDSRVPLEPLFDQGFGDLFVIRVAGNVAATDELGSIEYAANHLGVRFVLVLGHEQCGAVTAALAPESDRQHEAADIRALLERLEPAFAGMPAGLEPAERVHRGVEANVRHTVRMLRESPALEARVERGEIAIAGAVYELDTGKVRWLDDVTQK